MDSLTHMAVGGIIGDILVGRKLGRRAILYGAIFQSIPDIDFVASFFLDPVSDLIAHRGITHSFLFAIIVTPLVALLGFRYHIKRQISYKQWLLFCGMEILIHLFLDAFNAYGTGWFEPFDSMRVSFNSIFVVDPLFSVVPGVACIMLLIVQRTKDSRIWWARLGLGAIALYLTVSVASKLIVFNDVQQIAKSHNIQYQRYFTTPTPFNSLLWFVVLEAENGYNIGYRSVFDSRDSMTFTYFPRRDDLLSISNDPTTVQKLKRFSDGFYTAELRSDTLVFNDLRFGQQVGWYDPNAPFAFYYYLNYPGENSLVVQRGRFARWDRASVRALFNKMAGN